MTFFERMKFSAAATVVMVGLLMLIDMIGGFDWVNMLFSPLVIVPIYLFMLAIAPFLSSHIKYK